MKKIGILCLHLGYGGVEQASVNLANSLCEEYQVELVSAYRVVDKPPFYIDPRVSVNFLSNYKPNKNEIKGSLKSLDVLSFVKEVFKACKIFISRKSLMNNYVKKFTGEVLISTRWHYAKLLRKSSDKCLRIDIEHVHHHNNKRYIKRLFNALKGVDYLVPVSRELTDYYTKNNKDHNLKVVYIPNSLDKNVGKISNLNQKRIISVGRISPEKGYLDLIKVFKDIQVNHPDWKLDIVGDGEQTNELKTLIAKLNLNDVVTLHGYQEKQYIYNLLSKSSIYIMCSYEESFGIVLLEACSVGVPAVVFDSAQGAKEIIINDVNGYLIKNRSQKDIVDKINQLIEYPKLRYRLGKSAIETVDEYSFTNVKDIWLKFINDALNKK